MRPSLGAALSVAAVCLYVHPSSRVSVSPTLGSTWWSCCSSHKDASIRSSQLRSGRTVHLEFSSSTATHLPSYIIRVQSWSENWTVYHSVSLAKVGHYKPPNITPRSNLRPPFQTTQDKTSLGHKPPCVITYKGNRKMVSFPISPIW